MLAKRCLARWKVSVSERFVDIDSGEVGLHFGKGDSGVGRRG